MSFDFVFPLQHGDIEKRSERFHVKSVKEYVKDQIPVYRKTLTDYKRKFQNEYEVTEIIDNDIFDELYSLILFVSNDDARLISDVTTALGSLSTCLLSNIRQFHPQHVSPHDIRNATAMIAYLLCLHISMLKKCIAGAEDVSRRAANASSTGRRRAADIKDYASQIQIMIRDLLSILRSPHLPSIYDRGIVDVQIGDYVFRTLSDMVTDPAQRGLFRIQSFLDLFSSLFSAIPNLRATRDTTHVKATFQNIIDQNNYDSSLIISILTHSIQDFHSDLLFTVFLDVIHDIPDYEEKLQYSKLVDVLETLPTVFPRRCFERVADFRAKLGVAQCPLIRNAIKVFITSIVLHSFEPQTHALLPFEFGSNAKHSPIDDSESNSDADDVLPDGDAHIQPGEQKVVSQVKEPHLADEEQMMKNYQLRITTFGFLLSRLADISKECRLRAVICLRQIVCASFLHSGEYKAILRALLTHINDSCYRVRKAVLNTITLIIHQLCDGDQYQQLLAQYTIFDSLPDHMSRPPETIYLATLNRQALKVPFDSYATVFHEALQALNEIEKNVQDVEMNMQLLRQEADRRSGGEKKEEDVKNEQDVVSPLTTLSEDELNSKYTLLLEEHTAFISRQKYLQQVSRYANKIMNVLKQHFSIAKSLDDACPSLIKLILSTRNSDVEEATALLCTTFSVHLESSIDALRQVFSSCTSPRITSLVSNHMIPMFLQIYESDGAERALMLLLSLIENASKQSTEGLREIFGILTAIPQVPADNELSSLSSGDAGGGLSSMADLTLLSNDLLKQRDIIKGFIQSMVYLLLHHIEELRPTPRPPQLLVYIQCLNLLYTAYVPISLIAFDFLFKQLNHPHSPATVVYYILSMLLTSPLLVDRDRKDQLIAYLTNYVITGNLVIAVPPVGTVIQVIIPAAQSSQDLSGDGDPLNTSFRGEAPEELSAQTQIKDLFSHKVHAHSSTSATDGSLKRFVITEEFVREIESIQLQESLLWVRNSELALRLITTFSVQPIETFSTILSQLSLVLTQYSDEQALHYITQNRLFQQSIPTFCHVHSFDSICFCDAKFQIPVSSVTRQVAIPPQYTFSKRHKMAIRLLSSFERLSRLFTAAGVICHQIIYITERKESQMKEISKFEIASTSSDSRQDGSSSKKGPTRHSTGKRNRTSQGHQDSLTDSEDDYRYNATEPQNKKRQSRTNEDNSDDDQQVMISSPDRKQEMLQKKKMAKSASKTQEADQPEDDAAEESLNEKNIQSSAADMAIERVFTHTIAQLTQPNTVLGGINKIALFIISTRHKYPQNVLHSAVFLILRLMAVSKESCERHVNMIKTLLTSSHLDATLKRMIVVAISDLGQRFTNTIAVLFDQLNILTEDRDPTVRLNALYALTAIVSTEMLKPQKAFPFVCVRLRDPVPQIKAAADAAVEKLGSKPYSNQTLITFCLPDIISRVALTTPNLSTQHGVKVYEDNMQLLKRLFSHCKSDNEAVKIVNNICNKIGDTLRHADMDAVLSSKHRGCQELLRNMHSIQTLPESPQFYHGMLKVSDDYSYPVVAFGNHQEQTVRAEIYISSIPCPVCRPRQAGMFASFEKHLLSCTCHDFTLDVTILNGDESNRVELNKFNNECAQIELKAHNQPYQNTALTSVLPDRQLVSLTNISLDSIKGIRDENVLTVCQLLITSIEFLKLSIHVQRRIMSNFNMYSIALRYQPLLQAFLRLADVMLRASGTLKRKAGKSAGSGPQASTAPQQQSSSADHSTLESEILEWQKKLQETYDEYVKKRNAIVGEGDPEDTNDIDVTHQYIEEFHSPPLPKHSQQRKRKINSSRAGHQTRHSNGSDSDDLTKINSQSFEHDNDDDDDNSDGVIDIKSYKTKRGPQSRSKKVLESVDSDSDIDVKAAVKKKAKPKKKIPARKRAMSSSDEESSF